MRRLARIFSALVLIALLTAGAALIWLRPTPVVVLPPLGQIDRIVVEKSARRMVLFAGGQAVRSYHVALGRAPVGDKQRLGDNRTPEGIFHIDRKNAASAFHLSLGQDYPRPQDRAPARAAGFDPGGDMCLLYTSHVLDLRPRPLWCKRQTADPVRRGPVGGERGD